jgi:hypothetical protein
MRLAILTRIIAMGFSSRTKLERVEKAATAEAPPPSKPTGRRGFGRGGRRNNKAGGRGRGRKQEEERKGRTGSTVDDHQARLPGSPSFRYYCDDGVNAIARADEQKEKGRQ